MWQRTKMTNPGQRMGVALTMMGILALSGCDNSSGTSAPSEPQVIPLVQGQEFETQPGDELQPEGEANIRVRHVASTDTKFVTLLSGSAEVVRRD